MSIGDKFKNFRIASRLFEEQIYEKVFDEMENGIRRDGLWLKAIQMSDGNQEKAKAFYIEYCVQSIKDEMEIQNQIGQVILKEIEVKNNAKTKGNKKSPNLPQEKQKKPYDPVNGHDEEGLTPLMRAVNKGELAKVKQLLDLGADPHKTDGVFGATSAIDLVNRHLANFENKEKEKLFNSILMALRNA